MERKEKEEEALSLAAAVSSGRRDETSGLWEGDRKESRQRRSNMVRLAVIST